MACETKRKVPGMALLLLLALAPVSGQQRRPPPPNAEADAAPTALSFKEFFDSFGPGLKPSQKLRELNQHHVQLTGFMAQMEPEPEGSFYLVPRPVFCDEEGGGNADIPPEGVLVIVPFLSQQKIPFVPGPLVVTGTLELGNREENGRISSIRLILDPPAPHK